MKRKAKRKGIGDESSVPSKKQQDWRRDSTRSTLGSFAEKGDCTFATFAILVLLFLFFSFFFAETLYGFDQKRGTNGLESL